MARSLFFRLLNTPIDTKGDALVARIAALDEDGASETFVVEPGDFSKIPGSSFAYWVTGSIRNLFVTMPSLQSHRRVVCFGLSTKNDFRFLRAWWEMRPADAQRIWFPFAKGGAYSPFYYDVHLVIDWERD